MKEFIVSIRIDGRLDVKVMANTPEDAFEKSGAAFMDANLSDMDIVDSAPVSAYDTSTDTLTDY